MTPRGFDLLADLEEQAENMGYPPGQFRAHAKKIGREHEGDHRLLAGRIALDSFAPGIPAVDIPWMLTTALMWGTSEAWAAEERRQRLAAFEATDPAGRLAEMDARHRAEAARLRAEYPEADR